MLYKPKPIKVAPPGHDLSAQSRKQHRCTRRTHDFARQAVLKLCIARPRNTTSIRCGCVLSCGVRHCSSVSRIAEFEDPRRWRWTRNALSSFPPCQLSKETTPARGLRTNINFDMGAVEALYIFDEHKYIHSSRTPHKSSSNRPARSKPILEHVYTGRPPSASTVLPLYLAHPAPRPSLLQLPSTSPPVLVFSIIQDGLLFLSTSSGEIEPLLVIEFLHRVADALEDFLGAPLLASKVDASYDVVAQIVGEMCDAGMVCNTEPNALREVVEAPTWVGNLLGGFGLPSYATPHPTLTSLHPATNHAPAPPPPYPPARPAPPSPAPPPPSPSPPPRPQPPQPPRAARSPGAAQTSATRATSSTSTLSSPSPSSSPPRAGPSPPSRRAPSPSPPKSPASRTSSSPSPPRPAATRSAARCACPASTPACAWRAGRSGRAS